MRSLGPLQKDRMEPIGIDRHPSFPSQETKSLEENNRLKKALSWNLKTPSQVLPVAKWFGFDAGACFSVNLYVKIRIC